MRQPSLAFANTDVELKIAPIRQDWIIEGDPVARNKVLSFSEDRMAVTLVWDCTGGRFRWVYDMDETIHILEGCVHLTEVDGTTKSLKAGDVVFFPAGSTATWDVESYVRKLAFFRRPVPSPLSLVLRAMRKVGDLAAGGGVGGMRLSDDAAPAGSTDQGRPPHAVSASGAKTAAPGDGFDLSLAEKAA